MNDNNISHEIIENRTIYPIMNLEDKPMTITATEFKKNLGKYLELVATTDILITKNGKVIATLAKPIDKAAIWASLLGYANPTGEAIEGNDQIKAEYYEHLEKKHGIK